MAPHRPSADAKSAPTLNTLQVSERDNICFKLAFEKSIIMTTMCITGWERMCMTVTRNSAAPERYAANAPWGPNGFHG
jgi:hypothetical protein